MLKRRTFMAAAAATLLFSSVASAEYKAEYTVSTVLPSAFPWGTGCRQMGRAGKRTV